MRASFWGGRVREPALYNEHVMIDALLKKIFGTKHERDVKRMMPVVHAINELEASVTALLLQPFGPFILAIGAGLMAGLLGMTSGSVVLFGGTVLVAALVWFIWRKARTPRVPDAPNGVTQ